MKTNQDYLSDIEAAARVFCSKSTLRRAQIAVRTLKNRAFKAYQNGYLTDDEFKTLLNYLHNVEIYL